MAPVPGAAPALFLDRDGVIVADDGFLSAPDEVRLVPGAAAMIAAANRAAVAVAVVTNQSGIDRGIYGWAEFAAVQARIEMLLSIEGAAIDALAACPFHPEATAGYGAGHDGWRKPGPQMILALADMLHIDRGRSWMVGDRPRDVAAARAAGLAGAIRLRHPAGDPESAPAQESAPDFAVLETDGVDAALRILEERLFTDRPDG